jgi:PAS domain S-box-containing protein
MATSPASAPSFYERELPLSPERDALMRALDASEERFRLLAERTSLGVFRWNAEGRFVEVNPALVHMLGYQHELELYALQGEEALFVDPLDWARLELQLASGQVDSSASRWRGKDGSIVTVRLSARAVHDDLGRLIGYDGICEDVSDRLRHQQLLRRTERMACLGASLAGVAHELNNPLAAILGFAQLLLKRASDAEARAALQTIDHEAARASKIVRDLLTLTRTREVERRAPVGLNDIVRYIVRTRSYALETRGITCEATFGELRAVCADPAQLEQVVLNLLNNAEQAIRSVREEGGRIRITTRQEGDTAVLEVDDDGPGVADATREQIWDPFWTSRTSGDRVGLGLAIVRDIVVDHGGRIELERGRGPLGGARFVMRLPVVCGQAVDERGLARDPRRALDVLVVEPDAKSLNFLTAFLASRGHAALVAADVDYGVHLAQHLAFDAVICDAGIAGSSAALAAFRAAAGCAGARFIVVAGNLASTARLPVPLPPAARVVMRPYDLEELRVLLED